MEATAPIMATVSGKQFDLHQMETTRPKYERLKDYLMTELTAGRLRPGDALPSEPKLAESLQVARNTVRQALNDLEQQGLVRRVKGRGTYIHDDARRRLKHGLDAFALIVPETLGGDFYGSLLHGFQKACNAVHNEVIVRSSNNDLREQADAILALLDKDIGGVAIVPATSPSTPPYQIRQLQQTRRAGGLLPSGR